MNVDPGLYIAEIGRERGKVIATFQSSVDILPPPPVPLRLYGNSHLAYHIVTVGDNQQM